MGELWSAHSRYSANASAPPSSLPCLEPAITVPLPGHSYLADGPLLNGATNVVFEGVPTYPDAGRFWKMIEKHKVTIFYTAPTALRALMVKLKCRAAYKQGRRTLAENCLGEQRK